MNSKKAKPIKKKVRKKIGRPIIGSLKNIDVKVRIDEETNEKLLAYCKRNNITRAEAIRRAISSEIVKK